MFFPIDSLKKGGRFYLCWVADSWPSQFSMITHKQLLTQDISKICDDIIEVVKKESGQPTNRFSLRLSSQLMRGLVRLYQRKTSVFLSELCVLNAQIMKNVNKKLYSHERRLLEHRVRRPLQQITDIPQVLQIQDDHEADQKVEDLIRNSRNVVWTIQDITLKEPTIPELLMPPTDGFGEENPEQALQLIGDRTLEVMLQRDSIVMQHSGLELPLDITGKSQDKSHPPHELQMERISEHDITMFGKDIPEIPDIPLPDLPVPQMTKLTTEDLAPPHQAPTTSAELPPTLQIQLEDLDENEIQPKRRRVKNKLIIDKNIKIPGDVIRSRLSNNRVELRCQKSLDDKIDTRLSCDVYFRHPCHVGRKITSGISLTLTRLFLRNLGLVSKKPLAERSIEKAMARPLELVERSLVENIEEVCEPALQVVTEIPPERVTEVDISKEGFVNGTELRKSIAEERIDISDLVTQKVVTLSQKSHKRADDGEEMDNVTIKRKRSAGYVSYRQSQQEITRDAERSIQAMLQKAGLSDIQTYAEQQLDVTEKSRRRESDSSETPLGSLDRTKVSLGDSEKLTDSQRFIREQWGIEGTLVKITLSIRNDETPITMEKLLAKGPVLPGKTKVMAAKCFTSILKLKQHGFINIKKKIDSSEIADITLSSKFYDLIG